MKWIDDQDDYFLRDFDSAKNNQSGPEDNSPTAAGSNQATSGNGDTDSRTTSQTGSGNEFSFNPGGDSNADSSSAADNAARTRRRRRHRRLAWFFIIVFAVLAVAFYIRYFVPYTSDTLTTGYITLVEKRGIFFKTFEGEMISESVLADTSKIY